MDKKQKIAAMLMLIAAVSLLAIWFFLTHVPAGGRYFPRNEEMLDLRSETITPEEYQQLRSQLPGCRILWNVPFQGQLLPNDCKELTVASLTDADLATIPLFPELETVNAMRCTDYPQLTALAEARPDLNIRYAVTIDGVSYPHDTTNITLSAITDEQINLLQYLPRLQKIDASRCTDPAQLMQVKQQYPHCDLTYSVSVAGKTLPQNARSLTLTGADPGELLEKLEYLPEMKSVNLINPLPDKDALLSLSVRYPETAFNWRMDILGVPVTSNDTEADFSGAVISSLEELEAALACFPDLELVYLGECGIDNDVLAAYRERVREDYKVAWLLKLGLMPVRTDATSIMPGRPDDRYYVSDKQAELLRYCEDMICVDLGHYDIVHCDWAAHMPKLKYLILADTDVSDISPLANLQELVFLELFLSPVADVSPLLNLKNLEDLNLSFAPSDPEAVKQMTWLKRLWWADAPVTEAEMQKYLPDTELCFIRRSSTGGTWRLGQNYFDMRDVLGMYYMVG